MDSVLPSHLLCLYAEPLAAGRRVLVVGDATQDLETRLVAYYALSDIVSLQFACVRMIGQVPFFGAAIAELGETDEDPEVSVPTELVTEAEPPEYFIALASHSDHVRLEPYAI